MNLFRFLLSILDFCPGAVNERKENMESIRLLFLSRTFFPCLSPTNDEAIPYFIFVV